MPPAKKTWTIFLVFLRVRRKSFDYSAAPTTRLADSGFLYVLVVKRTFAIRFATCSWIVATSWLISGAFPPLMQACPLPPQMFLQFRGGDCLNDSHMCPQHDRFPDFHSKKNSERLEGLFYRHIFFSAVFAKYVSKRSRDILFIAFLMFKLKRYFFLRMRNGKYFPGIKLSSCIKSFRPLWLVENIRFR